MSRSLVIKTLNDLDRLAEQAEGGKDYVGGYRKGSSLRGSPIGYGLLESPAPLGMGRLGGCGLGAGLLGGASANIYGGAAVSNQVCNFRAFLKEQARTRGYNAQDKIDLTATAVQQNKLSPAAGNKIITAIQRGVALQRTYPNALDKADKAKAAYKRNGLNKDQIANIKRVRREAKEDRYCNQREASRLPLPLEDFEGLGIRRRRPAKRAPAKRAPAKRAPAKRTLRY